MRRLAFALISSALCCGGLSAGWIRLETNGIEMFSDASEKSARPLMERFERARGVFRHAGIGTGPLRLRVFVFATREEFQRYRDDAAGFYQSAPERDYIALYDSPDAGRVAFHEYVHLVMRHSSVPLPRWFDEGMAEFYSTMQIQKDGIRFGDPIAPHVELLGKQPWLDAASLETREQGVMYYAESWALVHMLNLAPRWRDGMPRFVLALAQEKPVDDAFRSAFGRSMEDAIRDLRSYVQQMRATTIAATMETPEQVRVSRIGDEEGSIACAGLALAVRRFPLAAKIVEKLPASAAAESARGAVELAGEHREEARKHFDRAIALGSRDASLYFEYAMLERDAGRSDRSLLEKTLSMDPQFADAHFLIGVRATDDEDYKSALDHLDAATRARPDRSAYWHALGYAQARAGDTSAMKISARRAIRTAENDQEEAMAQELLNLIPLQVRESKRPSVITPPSWQEREGDATVEGTLIDFDCSGPALRIREANGALRTLRIARPNEVKMVNAPGGTFQFSCGPQNLRVAIEYDSASEDVVRIEFRL